jgi:hypothetical protein
VRKSNTVYLSAVTLKEEGKSLTKVFISPINSPLDPWIRVPLSQIASVTEISTTLILEGRDIQADIVILAVGPSSYSTLTT